jgi:hypothetical protein
MKRWLMGMVAVLAAAGCKAPAPTLDPFLGRQTVLPPRPGEVVAALPDQAYYPSAPPTPASARLSSAPRFVPTPPASPPVAVTRATNPPPTAKATSDPTPVVAPRPLRSASPEERPPATGGRSAPQSTASGLQALRGTGTRVPAISGTPASAEPRRFVPTPGATDIFAWRGAPASSVTIASHATAAAAPESWTAAPTSARTTAGAAVTDSQDRYGHDAGYTQLKGRLEYSGAARRWKLRYIPLDGQTDDYGGSVVLMETPLLDGFRAGDYVIVVGQVSPQDTGSQAFAPFYQAERIDRVPSAQE